MKLQALLTLARDVGLIVVGLGGIIYQQVTGQVNLELLLVYLTLLGIPGALGLLQLRGGGNGEPPPTAGPPSDSPSSSSSSASR